MAVSKDRDHVIAGVFVLTGLVLGLVVILLITDLSSYLENQQTVLVRYGLSDGLRGLKEGAQVTLGDQPVGYVGSIADEIEQADQGQGRVTGNLVSCVIPERYTVYRNAGVELVAPPLGSGTRLNIRSVGSGEVYGVGDVITGQIAGSALTQSLVQDVGIRSAQREHIQVIIENIRSVTLTLKQDLPEIAVKVRQVLGEAVPLAADARLMAEDLKLAAGDVRGMVGDMKGHMAEWLVGLDNAVAGLDESVGRIRRMLADKDTKLRATVDDVQELAAVMRDKAAPKLVELLDTATVTLGQVRQVVGELQAVVIGQGPVLERMLAELQLTSGQLKLAAIEIRRAPWRLLYQPDDHELETENLYDAARSFALAAGALESTVASLRGMVSKGVDDQKIQNTLEYLEKLTSKFGDTEQAFWDQVGQRTGAKGQ